MMKKHLRNLSSQELRTVAALCAAMAVLVGVAVVLSNGVSWPQSLLQQQDASKPWAMELP